MNGRAVSFFLLSSLILTSAMILQNVLAPPKPPANVAENAAVENPNVENPNVDVVVSDDVPAEGDRVADGEASGAGAEKSENNQTVDQKSDEQDQPNEIVNDDQLDGADDDVEVEQTAAKKSDQDVYVTIGSLSEASLDRYLITINQRAGTIHRIELNFRNKKNGRYKYRDLENDGGYLGSLDCVDRENKCVVRTVGPGTPADDAKSQAVAGGLIAGDVLLSLNGEPIVSSQEFNIRLATKTKPGDDVDLTVDRDGTKISFKATLTTKPIELIRPEETRLSPELERPESFIFSLLKPMPQVDQAWPDIDPQMRDSMWELVESETGDDKNQVVLKYEIPDETMKKLGLAGPISVFKRFKLPQINPDDIHNINSRSFHLGFEIEIENGSEQNQKLAFELDGPTGTPSETWWYANKIHGRSTAIGYVAGARDVVGSTERRPFVFYGGPEIVKGAKETRPDVYFISSPLVDSEEERMLNYVGVDAQYFSVMLLPETTEDNPFTVNSVSAFINGGEIPKNVRLQKLVDCTFQMVKAVEIPAGQSFKQSFEVFSGPKEASLLDDYGLGDLRSFGWFAWCSRPLMWLLHVFYTITGKFSYGLAIIMLTILVRCCMIPFSRKAALNAQMMQHLQPQMKDIADKYKDDMEKRASSQRELFKKHKYNPFGGCFMMFFQLPIFIGLYRGLAVDITLRDAPLIPGMSWCSDLSAPDHFMYWKDWMPSMLADETGWLGPFLNILPIITMVLFIAQQKLFMPPAADEQQKMMQKMMSFMMIFMGVMFFKVPSGLCVYFITSSIWGILERKLLPKPVLATDDLDSGSGGSGGSSPPGGGDPALTKAQKKHATAKKKKAVQAEVELADRKRRNSERKKRLKERGV